MQNQIVLNGIAGHRRESIFLDFLIVLLPFAILICGTFELARVIWLQRGVHAGIHETMRLMATNPSSTTARVVDALSGRLAAGEWKNVTVRATISSPSNAASSPVLTVSVEYQVTPLFSGWFVTSLDQTVRSRIPVRLL